MDSYISSLGNLVARANVTEIPYVASGTYTCKAESNGLSDEMTITLTVQCRKSIQITLPVIIISLISYSINA